MWQSHLTRRFVAVGRRRWLFKSAREFVKEWKEMSAANQPMPDPPNLPKHKGIGAFFSIGFRGHWRVLKETLHLYRLSLFDREEAIRLIKIELEIARQIEEAKRLNATGGTAADGSLPSSEPRPNINTDMVELTERVRKMFPKEVASVNSVEDAVRLAKSKRQDLQELAEDRLELLGSAIHSFMEGYRQGKDKARADVDNSTDPFVERLFAPLLAAEEAAAKAAAQARAQVEANNSVSANEERGGADHHIKKE